MLILIRNVFKFSYFYGGNEELSLKEKKGGKKHQTR
jgi:hypothetical protein